MKIYLVGMPGSGKTTLGKKLAPMLALDFIDLDQEIENFFGAAIPKIFIEKGEDHFRQVESQLLAEYASSNRKFVMATGGGAPCFFRGMDVINKSGLSIFLNVPLKMLLTRLREKTDRPLLDDKGNEMERTLMRMMETRLPCYRQATITVNQPDLDKVLEAIHFQK